MGQTTKVIDIIIQGRDQASAQFKKLDGSIKATGQSTKNLAQDMSKVGQASSLTGKMGAQSFSSLNKVLTRTKKAMTGIGDHLAKVGPAMTIMGASMAAPFAIGITKAGSFQKEMSNVKAVTGATGQTFQALTDIASKMGAETAFTAKQSGEALSFLGMAGLSAQDSIKALPGTLTLASAGSLDLGEAADIATNVLAGMRMPVSQLSQVVDALAVGATSANTDVRMLGDGMKVVGPAAAASGESLQNMVALLGALANNGIKGAEGGTAVRNMLIRLQNPTSEAAGVLKELGVNVFDSTGKFQGLIPIMGELGKANMNTTQAAELFGMRTAVAALAAGNASADIQKLTLSLDDMNGKAKQMADTKLDNFQGSVTRLLSAFDGLMITIGNKFLPVLTGLTNGLTTVVRWFNSLQEALGPLATVVDGFVFAIGGLLATLGTLAIAWKFVIQPLLEFKEALAGMQILQAFSGTGAAVAAETATMAGGMETATGATFSLEAAMSSLLPVLGTMALAFAAFWGVSKIVELVGVMREYITVANEQEKISQSYANAATQFQQFAGVQIKSNDELAASTTAVNQAYAVSLEGALKYWEKMAQSEAAAGGVTEETQAKVDSIIEAMGRLHQTDPAVTFEAMGTAAEAAKAPVEGVTQAVEDLAAQIAATDVTAKQLTVGLKETFNQLKLDLAQNNITEAEYRQKRLEAEKTHWDAIVQLREEKLNALAASGKNGTVEYNAAMNDLVVAETKAITSGKKLTKELDEVGHALKDIPAKEERAELSFKSLISTLESQLARGAITEKQYRQKRKTAEVKHWQDIVKIRKIALELSAKEHGKDSKEWLKGNIKLRKAEKALADILNKKVTPALKTVGATSNSVATVSQKAAKRAGESWKTFADRLGISVKDAKQAMKGLRSDIDKTGGKLSALAQRNKDLHEQWEKERDANSTKGKTYEHVGAKSSDDAVLEEAKGMSVSELADLIKKRNTLYQDPTGVTTKSSWWGQEHQDNQNLITDLTNLRNDKQKAETEALLTEQRAEAQKKELELLNVEKSKMTEHLTNLEKQAENVEARLTRLNDQKSAIEELGQAEQARANAQIEAINQEIEAYATKKKAALQAFTEELAQATKAKAAALASGFDKQIERAKQDLTRIDEQLTQRKKALDSQIAAENEKIKGFTDAIKGLQTSIQDIRKTGEQDAKETSKSKSKLQKEIDQLNQVKAKLVSRGNDHLLSKAEKTKQAVEIKAVTSQIDKKEKLKIALDDSFAAREEKRQAQIDKLNAQIETTQKAIDGLNANIQNLQDAYAKEEAAAETAKEKVEKNMAAVEAAKQKALSELEKAAAAKQKAYEERVKQDVTRYKQRKESEQAQIQTQFDREQKAREAQIAQIEKSIKTTEQNKVEMVKNTAAIQKLVDALQTKIDNFDTSGKDPNATKAPGMATGGVVGGTGTGDTVNTWLTPGEVVLPVPVLRSGRIAEFLDSLPVNIPTLALPKFPIKMAEGGTVPNKASESVEVTLNIGGERATGLFQKDQARSLIESLQGASMVAV